MIPLLLLALGLCLVLVAILKLKWHAFPALLLAAAVVGWLTPEADIQSWVESNGGSDTELAEWAAKSTSTRIAEGFGTVCRKIGILIALASLIGVALVESGAADRLVKAGFQLFGERGAPKVFLSSGFLLGIPVFFDTVFYLLIPLGRALARQTRKNYALYVMTIIGGASMAHSLVPPTPGPLFVAAALNVPLHWMIFGGLAVGAVTSSVGYAFAVWGNRRWNIPIRNEDGTEESFDESEPEQSKVMSGPDSELQEMPQSRKWQPPIWASLAPILLPLILIGGGTVAKSFLESKSALATAASFLGDKNVALGISAGVACWLWALSRKQNRIDKDNSGVAEQSQSALASAGSIILITAAGGAFGSILQQTGIANVLGSWLSPGSGWTLPLAFLVTTLIRTAQGSATVAMLTVAGIFSGMATSEALGFHPVYLALAIGVGSKPFAWMNDSGFWIIGKLSRMTEGETLKTFSVMTTVMALSGLVVICLAAWLAPLN